SGGFLFIGGRLEEHFLDGRTLNNAGTATAMGKEGDVTLKNGAVINNQAGGTFVANADFNPLSIHAHDRTAPAFNNAGTLRTFSATSAATSFTGVAFNNGGAVEVQSGGLNLFGGGTSTGRFTLDADTALNLGGTYTLAGGLVDGAGTLTSTGTLYWYGG